MSHLEHLGFGTPETRISVGMLTADLQKLGNEVERLQRAGAGILHFDVMDGCFVPTLTFGTPIIASVCTELLKDVHLMVQSPLQKVGSFIDAGADVLTVHIESCVDIRPVLLQMQLLAVARRTRPIVRGLALKPDTPVELLEPLLDAIDYVLLLAVEPGLSQQSFRSSTAHRLRAVREMARTRNRNILVGVDGGVTRSNVREVADMHPDVLVVGSAIFNGGDPIENFQAIAQAVRSREGRQDVKSMVGC